MERIMPLFDYECNNCNIEEERLVSRDLEHDQKCKECGEHMKKSDKIGKTSFQLKGRWYKTTKSY